MLVVAKKGLTMCSPDCLLPKNLLKCERATGLQGER